MEGSRLGHAPRVRIYITEEIIEQSVARDSGHCMIAEAIKAAVPNASHVSVDIQTIRWSDRSKGERYTYLTPRPGQVGVVRFDQGVRPVPFGFELRDGQVTRSGKTKISQRTLRRPRGAAGSGSSVPEVVGGRTPPLAALSNLKLRGKRRAYGLRALEM